MNDATTKPKRPYTRPRIVCSEAFERLALGCNGSVGAGRSKVRGQPCSTQGAS